MNKTFRPWDVDQKLLLPPSVQDFVPAGHPAHFVRDLVREELDLSAIVGAYDEARGGPPYDPFLMTALLLYGYSRGIYSSRRLARACEERVDVMAVSALARPDFRTISEFRRRHLKALGELFVQVLKLCARAGLAKLGHVALDGTKLQANASKHKAMSYGRMKKAEAELAAEVSGWLATAEAADAAEDAEHGADRRGDETPEWMKEKRRRLEKIREAKAALEAEARAEAEREGEPKSSGGRKPKTPPGEPKESAQRNFTDPESRIMKGKDGFLQGYNAQAAVDGARQVIVAHALTACAADHDGLEALLDGVERHLGRAPEEVSADAGYCSEANLALLEKRGVRAYVATGGRKRPGGGERRRRGPRVEAMRRRLKRAGRRSRYRLRKQIVEPVFGQIKEARGFRRFLLRGLEKVRSEWALLCAAHNVLKLAAA